MKILTLLLLLLQLIDANAQLHLPELSPRGVLSQQVGYVKIELQYGRPAARGRKIMGDLVPFGKLWRTGGGKGTTISFDQPVIIANKTISPGIYALVTIPNSNEWTVLINKDISKLYGDPSEYDVANEVARLTVKPERTSRFYESLTFDLDIADNDAILYLSWENTQIHFPIETNSNKKALEEIRLALEKNPNDEVILSQASFFYFMNNKSMEIALQNINKALALNEDRWYYEQKINILERMKNFAEARKTAVAAIAFLKRTKPAEWEGSIEHYEKKINEWNKSKY